MVFLAFVVLIYESPGGMRAVACIDIIQGIILFTGLIGIFTIVMPDIDELTKISNWLIEHEQKNLRALHPISNLLGKDCTIDWFGSRRLSAGNTTHLCGKIGKSAKVVAWSNGIYTVKHDVGFIPPVSIQYSSF